MQTEQKGETSCKEVEKTIKVVPSPYLINPIKLCIALWKYAISGGQKELHTNQ